MAQRSKYVTLSEDASHKMTQNFSDTKKYSTWRRLWLQLAKAEMGLGLNISNEQVAEMAANLNNIDFKVAEAIEEEIGDSVMAHMKAFAKCCPEAAPVILHLSSSSAYIADNTELIQIRDGFNILLAELATCICPLSDFAEAHRSLLTLDFSPVHRISSPTTVGKCVSGWVSVLLMELKNLEEKRDSLRFRGIESTEGEILQLLHGDKEKVKELDKVVTEMAGFKSSSIVLGPKYSTKIDVDCLCALASLGESVNQICADIKILAERKEIEGTQTGSSAIHYERNPLPCDECCLSAHYLKTLATGSLQTASMGSMRQTLDYAERFDCLAKAFLSADLMLNNFRNVCEGLDVCPGVIRRRVMQELPFMAAENILIAMVKSGYDQQECQKKIDVLSHEAEDLMKKEGRENDFIERIRKDPYFSPIHNKLDALTDPSSFVGTAPEQVSEFITEEVKPVLQKYT